jgi:hypothetical protein
MCTVSIVSLPDGFRLACNRDELLSRPTAQRPVTRHFGDRRAAFPLDPQSGGTWVAVNDTGLTLAVLNVNAPAPARRLDPTDRFDRQSRGLIIPSLLHCFDANEAYELASAIAPQHFPPFRLIILDALMWADVRSDGWDLTRSIRRFNGSPLMFTSSGLGDDIVEQPRRELFDRMIGANPHPGNQDAFHSHHWPDRPHLSVVMNRDDARTVSHTIIEVRGGVAQLKYTPVPLHQLQPL